MNIIDTLETEQAKNPAPALRAGETVKVYVKVVEGDKERTQVFEGVVIALSGKGSRETFTVRKISYGVGVERIFPVHSPRIEKIDVVSRGRVRRAKLYYLRSRRGREARLFEESR
jgi:large subunit ribosomal protein L19